MIDTFALAITHALLFLGIWRIATRLDLDGDAAEAPQPKRNRRGSETPGA